MSDEHDTTLDEQLVAYLDGELPPDERSDFEDRLSNDSTLRKRLRQHQRAWDLLDSLPRTNVDDAFARSTVEMVALSAAEEIQQAEQATSRSSKIVWWITAEVLVVAALLGFLIVRVAVSGPNRQLAKDLPILEELDAYRFGEDIEFLRALEREGLFNVESEDDL